MNENAKIDSTEMTNVEETDTDTERDREIRQERKERKMLRLRIGWFAEIIRFRSILCFISWILRLGCFETEFSFLFLSLKEQKIQNFTILIERVCAYILTIASLLL